MKTQPSHPDGSLHGRPFVPSSEAVIHVVKLGGSLLDLKDLANRFEQFVGAYRRSAFLVLVGGGRVADVVRAYDDTFSLDERVGHWLAIRAMQLNTYLALAVLGRNELVADLGQCHSAWRCGALPVVDPVRWLENEQARGTTIPHRWSFTSDSIAAHIAQQVHAQRLSLLKSTGAPGCDVQRAIDRGLLDSDLAAASASLKSIELVNLRDEPPSTYPLR